VLILRIGRASLLVLLVLLWLWTLAGIFYSDLPGEILRGAVAVGFGTTTAWAAFAGRGRRAVALLLAGFVLALAGRLLARPSNDRDWSPDEAVLATAEIRGDLVTVRNVRRCVYESKDVYEVTHSDPTFDLRELQRIWFVVSPFRGNPRAAHTFVSFEFAGGSFLSISVEIRKERGEEYGLLPGLFRRYELMYVVAEERDLIGLRVLHRGESVYLYPAKTTPGGRRAMFLGMLRRANRLAEEPEFYDTIANTCTTNLMDHVNDAAPGRLPSDWRVWVPGYADELALEAGLLDTDLDLDAARERHRIDTLVRRHASDPDFSLRIRGG